MPFPSKPIHPESFRVFGLRLPSPFNPCVGTGSHLTQLSEPRWRHTNLVPSLLLFSFEQSIDPRKTFCQAASRLTTGLASGQNVLEWTRAQTKLRNKTSFPSLHTLSREVVLRLAIHGQVANSMWARICPLVEGSSPPVAFASIPAESPSPKYVSGCPAPRNAADPGLPLPSQPGSRPERGLGRGDSSQWRGHRPTQEYGWR